MFLTFMKMVIFYVFSWNLFFSLNVEMSNSSLFAFGVLCSVITHLAIYLFPC